MNAPAPALTPPSEVIRPGRMVTERFEAFLVVVTGSLCLLGEADNFDDAYALALEKVVHKSKLMIRRTSSRGGVTLHLFQITQRARPDYRYVDHRQVRVPHLDAKHLTDIRLVEDDAWLLSRGGR